MLEIFYCDISCQFIYPVLHICALSMLGYDMKARREIQLQDTSHLYISPTLYKHEHG